MQADKISKNDKLLEKESHLYVPGGGGGGIYSSIFRGMLCHFSHWLFQLLIIVSLFSPFVAFFLEIAFSDKPVKILKFLEVLYSS